MRGGPPEVINEFIIYAGSNISPEIPWRAVKMDHFPPVKFGDVINLKWGVDVDIDSAILQKFPKRLVEKGEITRRLN